MISGIKIRRSSLTQGGLGLVIYTAMQNNATKYMQQNTSIRTREYPDRNYAG